MSPQKARVVGDLVRGKKVNEALTILALNPRKPARELAKVVRSAVANATQKNVDVDELFIKRIMVDGGPVLKRWMPRAMGRATRIRKRTSHVTIVLDEA
jgi:large subunit ribosomal protein L22